MNIDVPQPPHLDAESDFLASTGPSRTIGTVKGRAQLKIRFCAKNTGGVYGFAVEQAGVVRGL
jgi:hypothetical protein